jgi:phosphatidylglycerophosphate synthase
MTLGGLIFPLIHLAVLIYYDWTFSETLPQWTFLLGALSMFWFQTIDATDGKQARKTDNCSPLGQLLDHSNSYYH